MRRTSLESRLTALEAGAPERANTEVTLAQQAQIHEVIAWMRLPEADRAPLSAELEEMLAVVLEAREAF